MIAEPKIELLLFLAAVQTATPLWSSPGSATSEDVPMSRKPCRIAAIVAAAMQRHPACGVRG